jgi:hypothetical protein
MRRRLGLSFAAGLLACSCGGGGVSSYPTNIQSNYLNSCESNGGNTADCSCTLHWFESHVSLTQFQADEDQVRTGGLPDDVSKAINDCR